MTHHTSVTSRSVQEGVQDIVTAYDTAVAAMRASNLALTDAAQALTRAVIAQDGALTATVEAKMRAVTILTTLTTGT